MYFKPIMWVLVAFLLVGVVLADDALSVGGCPLNDNLGIILGLMLLVSFAFVVFGVVFGLNLVGLFGSLMFLVDSFYVAGCSWVFAFLLCACGVILLAFFIFRR